MSPSKDILPPEQFPSDNEGGGASRGFERDVEVEFEGRRPTRKQPKESLKATENTKQQKDGLLEAPSKAKAKGKEKEKAPPKRRKLGKKALQARREMSQLLDAYTPPPSNSVIPIK